MAVALDLADIQGNILSAYGKLGFPKGRFITLHVDDAASGRKFVNALLPEITTALRWPSQSHEIPAGVGRGDAAARSPSTSRSHGMACSRSGFRPGRCAACRTNSSTA